MNKNETKDFNLTPFLGVGVAGLIAYFVVKKIAAGGDKKLVVNDYCISSTGQGSGCPGAAIVRTEWTPTGDKHKADTTVRIWMTAKLGWTPDHLEVDGVNTRQTAINLAMDKDHVVNAWYRGIDVPALGLFYVEFYSDPRFGGGDMFVYAEASDNYYQRLPVNIGVGPTMYTYHLETFDNVRVWAAWEGGFAKVFQRIEYKTGDQDWTEYTGEKKWWDYLEKLWVDVQIPTALLIPNGIGGKAQIRAVYG